ETKALHARATTGRAWRSSSWLVGRVRVFSAIGFEAGGFQMADYKIEGEIDKRFEGVRKAFAENLEKRGELGAACSIVLDGKPVVDIWGGHADKLKTKPWQRDTLVNVYSTTKG